MGSLRDGGPAEATSRRAARIGVVGLLLSPGEAAVNEGTAARQEIEQVLQRAAHCPNHEAAAVSGTAIAALETSATGQMQAPLSAAADDRFDHPDVAELTIELAT